MLTIKGPVGVAGGEIVLFNDFSAGGVMWEGDGARELRRQVRFSQPFEAVPQVMTAISLWDVADGANLRADLTTDEVSETGFTVVFRTWGDTRIARMRVRWQAIGAARDEEMWDIE